VNSPARQHDGSFSVTVRRLFIEFAYRRHE